MDKTFKSLISLIMIVSLAGCATWGGRDSKKPVYPTPLNDEMKQSFTLAEQTYLNKNFTDAEKLYQAYITAYGYNEYTDEAKFKLGEIAFMKNKFDTALTYYNEAYQNLYNPEIAPKAQFKAALTLYNLKRYDQALSVLDQMERRDLSEILALRSDSLAMRLGERLGSSPGSMIKWYLFLLDDYDALPPSEYEGKIAEKLVSREVAYQEALKWARDANVTLEQVNALPIDVMKKKTSGGFVFYKLGLVYFANGDFEEAAKYMNKFVRGYPKHELAQDGHTLLAELKGKVGGKTYKVGVILPLSGRFKIYGDSALNGIRCAAGLVSPCTSPLNIELVVKDSAGMSSAAVQAVDDLAKEGVVAIVGSLVSACAESAAKRAQELKIPMVSLSHKEGIADIGDYIFKHSFTSEDQIDTLVDYAVGSRRFKRFGIIYPANAYGATFARMFRTAVEAAGGEVVYTKEYSHQDLQSSPAAKEMGGITSFDAPVASGGGTSFAVPGNVEAIFIPDSYKAINHLIMAVHSDSEKLASNVLFMGVNRWNNPGLVGRDMGLLEGSVFVDGFFKRSADVTTRHFVQSFQAAFGIDPTILEAQAYDALEIVMAGIGNGGTSRVKLASAIQGLKNIGGVTGSITISRSGESRRRLFILTIKNGEIAELSSARGAIKNTEFTRKEDDAFMKSRAKYEGQSMIPDTPVRTDEPKYDTTRREELELMENDGLGL